MDTLLSQLKGQGSPFSSPLPISNNVEKLLDTIHLLSQATVLVAHQLQEHNSPVKAKPSRETAHAYLPTPLPTPKSSPAPSVKKTPPPKPASSSVLSWVPRAPEYYRLSPPNPNLATHTNVATPAKPTIRTPHTKKDRKPKSKRTNPSTQSNPSPNPSTTPTTPRPASPDQRGPLAPPTPSPTPGSVQTDRCEPPNPLPTPTPSTLSTHTNTDADNRAAALAARKARMTAKRLAKKLERRQRQSVSTVSTPTPTPTPTPPPNPKDAVAPIAPANNVVNFPHHYEDCPRLPECPAHRAEFAVSCQAYVARKRDAILPPPSPQPQPFYEGSEFELRAERDTAWWPVLPSDCSSSPGTPVDPEDLYL